MLKRVDDFLQQRQVADEIRENIFYLVPGGSDIFGTSNSNSDTDLRGIVLLGEDYVLGLKEFEHLKLAEGEGKINLQEDLDLEIFSLEKFMKQCIEGYSIPMEMLFLEEHLVMKKDERLANLYDNRQLFLTKKMVRNYIAMNKKFEHMYALPKTNVKNPLSRERVEKFGYETKFASKALQHYNVLEELLETGQMVFYRKEKQHLLDIKEGRVPLTQVTEEIKEKRAKVEMLYQNTTLPEKANFEKVNQIYKDIVKTHILKMEE